MSNIDFSRAYTDKSALYNALENPTGEMEDVINQEMGKFEQSDFKNCGACGYASCKNMTKAVLNGLYRPQQCHHYLESYYRKNSGDLD